MSTLIRNVYKIIKIICLGSLGIIPLWGTISQYNLNGLCMTVYILGGIFIVYFFIWLYISMKIISTLGDL